jgi:DNA replication protein DnaC
MQSPKMTEPKKITSSTAFAAANASTPGPCCRLLLGEELVQTIWPEKERDAEKIPDGARDAMRRCALGAAPWPLVFLGEAGSGKTCAALVLLDARQHQTAGYYRRVGELVDEVRRAKLGQLATSAGYPRTEYELWRDWTDASLCVLDELGARIEVSDHHYDTVMRALESRYGKPLVVISNMSLAQIEAIYDDRIASRLSAGSLVQFAGDRRSKGRKSGTKDE